MISRLLLFAILFSELAFAQTAATAPSAASPDIFRCPQPDGTIAFQGMPCSEPDSEEEADEARNEEDVRETTDSSFDFTNPFDEPADVTETPLPAAPPPLSTDRTECEKTARDAIDAIDLQMRQGYSREEGQAYMAELLKLTRALRACKEL